TAVQTTTSSITARAVGFRTTHSEASAPPGALRTSRARNGPTACSRVSVAGVQRWRRHRGGGVNGGGGSPGTPSARSVTVKSGLMAYWKRCASSQKPGAASHSGNGGAQTSPSPAPRYHLSSRGTRLFLKRRDLAQQLRVVAHTLPKLPYDSGALEPHIDRQTMEIHHTKHHQAYINNLNAALDKHPELHKKTLEELLRGINGVPEDIRTAVRNNAGGHHNHSLFWTIMAPAGKGG